MKQISIAEDESRIAAFLEKGFRKYGFTVAIACNGQEAIELTRKQSFDLLLLDLGLPLADGWTVLRQMCSQGDLRPVIIITAQEDEKQKASVLALGANDYITKPLHFNELLKRVQMQLGDRS